MRGFAMVMAKEATGAGNRAGKALGDSLERAAAKAGHDAAEALAQNIELAKGRVQDAADAITEARDKEATAAGRVRVAEEKLTELRGKGKATAAQLATAEERLAAAKRGQAAVARQMVALTAEEDQAKAHLTEATKRLETETSKGNRSIVRLVTSMEKIDTSRIDNGAKSLASFSKYAFASASGVSAIGSALPAVAGLGAVLGQASGAALILPGALAAGGVATGTLAVGLSGIADALGSWDDAEKFTEKIEGLSKEGRALAVSIRDARPQLLGLRNDVQSALLAGSSTEFKELAKLYVPLLASGMSATATELATGRRELVGFATDSRTVADLGLIMASTKTSTGELVQVIAPLLSALRDVGVVGGEVFAGLTHGAGSAAQRFADFIAAARESGQLQQWMYLGLQALDDLGELLGNVGTIVSSVLSAASTQGGGLLDTLNAVTGSVAAMLSSVEGQEALATFFRTVHDVVTNLQPGLHAVLGAVIEGVTVLGPALPPVASAFSDVAVALAPMIPQLTAIAVSLLPPVVALVRELAPVLPVVAAGFLAGVIALRAYNAVVTGVLIIQKVVQFTQAWTTAQWALNAAQRANVIGLIVTAIAALVGAIIWLWNNNEGFRNFWLTTWANIKAVVAAAWTGYLQPAFRGIVAAVQWVGDAAVWLWRNAFVPAWSAIQTGAEAAWSILSAIFDALSTAARIAAAVFITLFVTPYVIAFNLIRDLAVWVWENGLRPLFEELARQFRNLMTFLAPVGAAFATAFRAIVVAAQWFYDTVIIGVIVNGVLWYFNLWISAGQAVWSAITSILTSLGSFFASVWGEIGRILGVGIDWLNRVGAAFSLLYDVYVRPKVEAIGAVLRRVYESTILWAFNGIKDAIDATGRAFDTGVSLIERIWSGLKDKLKGPVNFVIDVIYNRGVRQVWNQVADFVGLKDMMLPQVAMLAGGGVLSGYSPGRDSVPALLSPGEAVLVPELVRQIGPSNILAANAAASHRRGTVVGQQFSGGGVVSRFAGGGIVGTIADWVGDIGQDVVDLFRDPAAFIRGRIGSSSRWVDQLAALPGKYLGKIGDVLWDKVTSWFGGGTESASGDLGKWIATGIRITGVDGSWFGPLHTLIMRESGGNPRAINNWDINAQRGDPSRGLMQTIGSTFNAYRDPRLSGDIYDPVANIVAGINYIKSRYGTIFAVQQAVGSTPMGYDSGGYLMPGVSTVYNGTGRPEPVLTSGQWDSLQRNGDPSGPLLITGTLDLGGGLEARIDGRIHQAQQGMGTALAARRRL
ncbi:transglycosylase SLT domain-containing protein [Lentzea sp. JNUCC 0626]|uniref:transglycosylase SLT domain-containing protein n=1 Tax=Lentzea sp. JNUCC 0626 TaxID=3367513 RepID=UPI0037478ACA